MAQVSGKVQKYDTARIKAGELMREIIRMKMIECQQLQP